MRAGRHHAGLVVACRAEPFTVPPDSQVMDNTSRRAAPEDHTGRRAKPDRSKPDRSIPDADVVEEVVKVSPPRVYSKIINAPVVPNDGGFEKKVAPLPAADKTAGANATMPAHTFELRVVQETGTH
jgi:hypothetical protein